MTQDVRFEQLTHWVHTLPKWHNATLVPASADASFRRYFRVSKHGRTAIAMDAPPDKESTAPFVDITARLRTAGVHAPQLLGQNLLDGFLLLEDLGNLPLLHALTPANVDRLYQDALQALLLLQVADADHLPLYDAERLRQEMNLMPEWFLGKHLGFRAAEIPEALIEETFDTLTAAVLEQPVAFVHRDYHSRNLMLTEQDTPGVIDYQDAVLGPITYDLVSLLRDCYIAWPRQRVEAWACDFRKEAIAAGNIPPVDEQSFLRWFDLTGLQRHLKVLGIFARLSHRDGKHAYLENLPLVLAYVMSVGSQHPETAQLVEWMRQTGIPQRIGSFTLPL